MNILSEANKLLGRMDLGDSQGVAYDTAWVARLKNANGKPMFPQSFQWLLSHQKKDGSWGCEIEYYHDRVLSTLASLIALAEDGKKKDT